MTQIENLTIRIAGIDGDEARSIGESVGEKLAARLPKNFRDQSIDSLEVKLHLSQDQSRESVAETIVTSILEQLRIK